MDFSDGSCRSSELTDCPGVTITDRHFRKEKRTERTIQYRRKKFDRIEDAVLAWEVDHL